MTRNKEALAGIIFNASIMSFLIVCVYFQLGQWGSVGFAEYLSVNDIDGANKAF